MAAMFVAGKLVVAHETTTFRTAKEYCWRQAHARGFLAPTKSVNVLKSAKITPIRPIAGSKPKAPKAAPAPVEAPPAQAEATG